MGTHMKVTVEIADPLFRQAKSQARRRGTTMRALIEEGLRRVIAEPGAAGFRLPDCTVTGDGPTELWTDGAWDDKLAVIYEGRT
jgi:hypothetical protein